MKKKRWLANATLAWLAFAPAELLCQQRLETPPVRPPTSCGINVATIANVSGSASYIRLRYEIEALNSAQESLAGFDAALKDLNSATSPTLAIAGLITGTNQARDSLLCAAYLMGQYRTDDDDDKAIRGILISAFNREAKSVADFLTHAKEQFVRPGNQRSNAVALRDAERISAMNAQQNEAATDILEVTTFSLLRALDNSDPNAKTVEYLTLSCDERTDLLARSAPLAHVDKSAYSTPATFIQKVLNEHKCRP